MEDMLRESVRAGSEEEEEEEEAKEEEATREGRARERLRERLMEREAAASAREGRRACMGAHEDGGHWFGAERRARAVSGRGR